MPFTAGKTPMDHITAIIKSTGAKRVAMFTDKGIEAAGLFSLPEEAVKAAGADYYVLDDLPGRAQLHGGPEAGG